MSQLRKSSSAASQSPSFAPIREHVERPNVGRRKTSAIERGVRYDCFHETRLAGDVLSSAPACRTSAAAPRATRSCVGSMRARSLGAVLVQGARLLFKLRGPPDGRACRAPDRSCLPRRAGPPVGAEPALSAALGAGVGPRSVSRGSRCVRARVLGSLRRRAQCDGIADGRGGAVAVIQRFGEALNLNVHIHALVMDWP
jgi:Putative transposase